MPPGSPHPTLISGPVSAHNCPMARRTIEKDRDSDASRLDEALDHVLGVIRTELPRSGDADNDAVNEIALAKTKLDACRALVPLLERRAKLLGLDATPGQVPSGAETAVERMAREIRERTGASRPAFNCPAG